MSDSFDSMKVFLKELYRLLKAAAADGEITLEEAEKIRAAVRKARSHAGGKAAAANAVAKPKTAAGDGNHEGLLVALWLDERISAAIAQEGGVAVGDHHITLFYSSTPVDDLGLARAIMAMDNLAREIEPPLSGRIQGGGYFEPSKGTDGKFVLYANPSVVGLADLRFAVSRQLQSVGIKPAGPHDWIPHITLNYLDKLEGITRIEGTQRLHFNGLTVAVGGHHVQIPFRRRDWYLYGERLFGEQEFTSLPEWINYLPKPQTYTHPSYGKIKLTRERIAQFVANFRAKIYQERLPIDVEHQTKLSGAVGWIVEMRLNEDGSADARVEWAERGESLLTSGGFKYFSPEWYNSWTDPADGTTYRDVAIGGAITTRPFFKEKSLRPLGASEGENVIMSDNQPTELSMQERMEKIEAERDALRLASEQHKEALTEANKRIAAMEQAEQHRRFTALSEVWHESDKHIMIMTSLASAFGEESEQFKEYIRLQRATAEQLRSSNLFSEFGSDASTDSHAGESALEQANRLAQEHVKQGMPYQDAMQKVFSENQKLYFAYRGETEQRI